MLQISVDFKFLQDSAHDLCDKWPALSDKIERLARGASNIIHDELGKAPSLWPMRLHFLTMVRNLDFALVRPILRLEKFRCCLNLFIFLDYCWYWTISEKSRWQNENQLFCHIWFFEAHLYQRLWLWMQLWKTPTSKKTVFCNAWTFASRHTMLSALAIYY